MIFFYGIRNYGKSNISTRYGACESCGQPGHLSSYDTARFLHLYWIPLIPAGHKRIIDLCPDCKACRMGAPGKLKKQKAQIIENLFAQLKKFPNDSGLIAEGLGTLAAYNEESLFEKLVQTYRGAMANNAEVQLAIAYGYFHFGRFNEAAASGRAALAQGASEEADELIAAALSYDQNPPNKTSKPPRSIGLPLVLPYLVPLLILGSILGSQVFQGINTGRARKVWLVNGTQVSYTIKLDDVTYRLKQYDKKRIKLPMGIHTVSMPDALIPIEPFVFEYKRSFWQRMTDQNILVLNPDGMAFLIEESIPYIADDSNQTAESKFKYYFGKKWHVLPYIEFAFRDVPENIEMPLYENVTYKDQLTLYKPETYTDALDALELHGTSESFTEFIGQAIRIHPETLDAQWMLQFIAGTNSLSSLDFLQAGLAHRPVLVEWHRTYQSAIAQDEPDHNLEAEYLELAAAEPDSPDLKYLFARVMEDPAMASAMFMESEQGEGCKGYGYHALAYNQLCQGQYSTAIKQASLAVQRSDGNPTFESTLSECQLANKQYAAILKTVRKNRTLSPENGELAALEIRYLCLMGKLSDSKLVESSYYSENSQWMDAATQQEWKDYFQATRCYVKGDMPGYLQALGKVIPESMEYQKALYEGDVQKNYEILKEEESTDYSAYLIVYCAAMHHGKFDTAKLALDSVINVLGENTELGEILSGEHPISPALLADRDFLPDTKKLIACTLGYLHPADKADYFKLTQTCNYSPFFPYHLINDWVTEN